MSSLVSSVGAIPLIGAYSIHLIAPFLGLEPAVRLTEGRRALLWDIDTLTLYAGMRFFSSHVACRSAIRYKHVYTTGQACALLGFSPEWLYKLERKGVIKPLLSKKGRRRWRKADIHRIAECRARGVRYTIPAGRKEDRP